MTPTLSPVLSSPLWLAKRLASDDDGVNESLLEYV